MANLKVISKRDSESRPTSQLPVYLNMLNLSREVVDRHKKEDNGKDYSQKYTSGFNTKRNLRKR